MGEIIWPGLECAIKSMVRSVEEGVRGRQEENDVVLTCVWM